MKRREDTPSITDGSSNMPSLTDTFCSDWKERSKKTEQIIFPSVMEFLGPNWKEYFLNPEAFKKIIRSVSFQDRFSG